MLKPIFQPSFATLAPAELDEVIDWLRHETYETVRGRVNKPRPEGFGLNLKSIKPLETLHAKLMKLDLINARLPADKKLTFAEFESIRSLRPLHPQSEIRHLQSDDVHQAIFHATCELVSAGNHTPAKLLSLQRLADFPARLELRAQQAEYQNHKIEMDLHRVHINLERLNLEKRRLELAAETRDRKQPSQNDPSGTYRNEQGRLCDHLGPIARTPEELRARVRAKFGYFRRPEPAATQPAQNPPATHEPDQIPQPESTTTTHPSDPTHPSDALATTVHNQHLNPQQRTPILGAALEPGSGSPFSPNPLISPPFATQNRPA